MKPTKWKSRIFLLLGAAILLGWLCALGWGVWSAFHAEKKPNSAVSDYSSQELGIHFSYPKQYAFNFRHDSFKGMEIHVITMLDTMVVVPDMSEGPTAISLIELPITPTSTLEAWVQNNSISNFYLSPDKTFSPTTVGGQPALAYTYSGLYESDAVAVQHAGKIYLFSASWLDAQDPIRTDFKNLLSSVTFIQ